MNIYISQHGANYEAIDKADGSLLGRHANFAILLDKIRTAYPGCNIFNADSTYWIDYYPSSTENKTGNSRRAEIIQEVSNCVLRNRQNSYGDAEDNFSDIALRWNNYLHRRGIVHEGSFCIMPQDVAIMMADLKITRAAANPNHLDNLIDGAGYFVCAGGIAKKRSENNE